MNLYKLVNVYLFISLVSCSSEIKECSNFKEGKFKYSESERFEIYRDSSRQVEIDLKNGMEVHSSITWETECSYVLTYDKFVNSTKDFSNRIGEKIYVDLIEFDSDRYKYHMKSDFSEDESWIIKVSDDDIDDFESKTEIKLSSYKFFYSKFEESVKNDMPYEDIVINYFHDTSSFKDKKLEGYPFSLSGINIAQLKSFLESGEMLNYYWDKEIIETTHSFYYDNFNCDCSLIIEKGTTFGFIPICFLKGKIYSIIPIADNRPTVNWKR